MKIHQIGNPIRQGDVLLVPVNAMPEGCMPVDGQARKIVLALGEATGHHHRIEDHVTIGPEAASEIAEAAIVRARLYLAPSGERFLEVKETVTLLHEEHSSHAIQPGIYELPVQMEYDAALMRRAAD